MPSETEDGSIVREASYLQIAILAFFTLLLRLVILAEREQTTALVDMKVLVVAFSLHEVIVGVDRFSEIKSGYL